jgi:DNA-binding GntR family transcriptional regulator
MMTDDRRQDVPPDQFQSVPSTGDGGAIDLAAVFTPTPRESLADKVIDQLRDAIVRGRFAPGEQLPESMLAEYLAVSRGPVREALRQLEREGLVIMRSNRSAIVARLTREDFEEVYTLRLALERLAAQHACRNATEADFTDMQAIVDQMIARVNQGITEKEAADLDLFFHDVVYRASRHKRLQSCWADLRPQIYLFLLSRNVADSDFRSQMIGHQQIVDFIRARDEANAVSFIEIHIRVAYERIIKSYST